MVSKAVKVSLQEENSRLHFLHRAVLHEKVAKFSSVEGPSEEQVPQDCVSPHRWAAEGDPEASKQNNGTKTV